MSAVPSNRPTHATPPLPGMHHLAEGALIEENYKVVSEIKGRIFNPIAIRPQVYEHDNHVDWEDTVRGVRLNGKVRLLPDPTNDPNYVPDRIILYTDKGRVTLERLTAEKYETIKEQIPEQPDLSTDREVHDFFLSL